MPSLFCISRFHAPDIGICSTGPTLSTAIGISTDKPYNIVVSGTQSCLEAFLFNVCLPHRAQEASPPHRSPASFQTSFLQFKISKLEIWEVHIFNTFKDISDPFHTEPLPQQPRQGLLPPPAANRAPTESLPRQSLFSPPAAHRALCYLNVIYQNGEKTEIRNPFFPLSCSSFQKKAVFENCKISKRARNT